MTDPAQFLLLHDGLPVAKPFFDLLWKNATNNLHTVKRNKRVKADSIYGEDFWDSLTDGERRTAGRCLAHMVALKLLPLYFAESKHEYPKYYRLA